MSALGDIANRMKQSRDTEYMTDTSAAVLESASMPAHIILWTAATFLIVAIVWANFARLDEVTRGPAKVIPSLDIQVIQNLEGGIVNEILVNEGDVVEKGQVLMIIDDTQFTSDLRESQIRTLALQAKIQRLTAEAEGKELRYSQAMRRAVPQMVADQLDLYETRQQELAVKIEVTDNDVKEKEQELKEIKRKQAQLKTSFDLISKELQLTYPLVDKGAVSQVDLLRLERTVNDMKGELEASEISIPRLESSLKTAKKKEREARLSFEIQAQTELSQTNAELKAIKESNLALADRVKRTSIRSPVKGTVNQVNISTIGGIIQPGEEVMEIVPLDDKLLVEAEIKPSDIGFITPNLTATVKITAYDFAIYGGLKGNVIHISPDTVLNEKKESVYLIRVKTDQNHLEKDGKQLPIITGMRASVDILTGHKSVMDYILKPILKTKQKAFTER